MLCLAAWRRGTTGGAPRHAAGPTFARSAGDRAPSAYQGQVDLVGDLDEDVVGRGGDAPYDELVAQQDDGDGGDPGVERLGGGLAARDGSAQDGQPGRGRRLARLVLELGEEVRRAAGGGEQFAQDRAEG